MEIPDMISTCRIMKRQKTPLLFIVPPKSVLLLFIVPPKLVFAHTVKE
jgi:hypothetical protein